ncbi:MAG: ABC transporter permease [Thermodesulfobacteriota bacterium]
MMRQLKILDFAIASLRRRKGKSLSIVLVFAFTVAALSSVLLLTHALRREATQLLAGAPDLVVQRVLAGRHDLIPASYQEKIARIPGVRRVTPRLWGYYYDSLTGSNFTLLGISDDAPQGLTLLAGRLPKGPDECAIGSGVAEFRGVTGGDDLYLINQENLGVGYSIVGVFSTQSDLLTHDLIIMDKETLRSFFAFPPGLDTDLTVEVYNPQEVDMVAQKIKREYPDARPITHGEIVRTYDAVFNWRSGMLLSIFSVALVAFSILAWDKATGLSAEERREIGVLKALGWDTGDVLLLKFWEGMAIALTAFLLGLTAALLHVFWLGAPLLAMVVKGWSVLFPEFKLVPYIDLQQIFILAFLTIVPYLVSTVIPCWRAAVTDPDSVMRG